jgi:hypothetical protein
MIQPYGGPASGHGGGGKEAGGERSGYIKSIHKSTFPEFPFHTAKMMPTSEKVLFDDL